MVLVGKKLLPRGADHLFEGRLGEQGKTAVGIENGGVLGQHEGALVHFLDEDAIGRLGAFEGENLVALRDRR